MRSYLLSVLCILSCSMLNADDWVITETYEEVIFPRTVLVTQIRTCTYCRILDRDVIKKLQNPAHVKSGWKVGKGRSNQFQILDIDNPDDVIEAKSLNLIYSGLPTLFFIEKNKVKVHSGTMSYTQYIAWAQPTPKKK